MRPGRAVEFPGVVKRGERLAIRARRRSTIDHEAIADRIVRAARKDAPRRRIRRVDLHPVAIDIGPCVIEVARVAAAAEQLDARTRGVVHHDVTRSRGGTVHRKALHPAAAGPLPRVAEVVGLGGAGVDAGDAAEQNHVRDLRVVGHPCFITSGRVVRERRRRDERADHCREEVTFHKQESAERARVAPDANPTGSRQIPKL